MIAAALLGALVGSDVYGVGIPGLLTAPVLLVAVVPAVRAGPVLSRRARHWLLGLSGVAAAAALGVGLTILL